MKENTELNDDEIEEILEDAGLRIIDINTDNKEYDAQLHKQKINAKEHFRKSVYDFTDETDEFGYPKITVKPKVLR